MTQGGLLLSSKKYLPWLAMVLFTLLILLSPRAYAADSGGDRACDQTTRPTPYANGAPVVRVFYPADGSTVTVTSTGAVIKQSPCGNPYREGWVDPAKICDLNSFDDLGGMINKSDSNPNPNVDPVYTCGTPAPAPSPTPTPAPAPAAAPIRPTETPVVQSVTITNPPAPTTPSPAPAVSTLPNTGASGVVAVGGISTVLGTVGHFFYRRRVTN